jgi:hypothetical protein
MRRLPCSQPCAVQRVNETQHLPQISSGSWICHRWPLSPGSQFPSQLGKWVSEPGLPSPHRTLGQEQARWRQLLPDASLGRPSPPCTTGSHGIMPVASGLLPWWPYLGRSHSHSLQGRPASPKHTPKYTHTHTHTRIHTHTLTTIRHPGETNAKSLVDWKREWERGLQEKGEPRQGAWL